MRYSSACDPLFEYADASQFFFLCLFLIIEEKRNIFLYTLRIHSTQQKGSQKTRYGDWKCISREIAARWHVLTPTAQQSLKVTTAINHSSLYTVFTSFVARLYAWIPRSSLEKRMKNSPNNNKHTQTPWWKRNLLCSEKCVKVILEKTILQNLRLS